MPGGSLDAVLASLTEDERVVVLSDVATALAALHAALVLHRDVAMRNVLLDARKRAKVCDFGLSCRSAYAWEVPLFPKYDWAPELSASSHMSPYTPA